MTIAKATVSFQDYISSIVKQNEFQITICHTLSKGIDDSFQCNMHQLKNSTESTFTQV
jgi:hypothetical protein